MKNKNTTRVIKVTPAALIVAAIVNGYSADVNAKSLAEAVSSGKVGVDLRYRYEVVDQVGFENKAQASTLRTRLNLKTGDYHNFSAFLEFDDVTAFGSIKYNDGTGLPDANKDYPVIADPEGTEVNQASLKYNGITETDLVLGRQRIIYDNARFIGNVGWRQNEQTYDAFKIDNASLAGTTFSYSYVDNVNRIFGEASPKGNDKSRSHFLNIAYDGFKAGKLTGYGYLLDFVDRPSDSNMSLGLRFTGGTNVSESVKLLYTLEYAKQSDYKDGADKIDADYGLFEFGAKLGGVTAKFGYEVLGGDGTYGFSTPLATLHAFNGWADKFLNTPGDGLVDVYVSVGGKVSGVKLMAVYHDFSSDSGGLDYGTELDLLVAKKFGKYTLLAKYAGYSADSHATDTDKFWLMAQATFK